MRTWKMMLIPTKKNAAFCRYLQANTADARCMYNTANYYIRNSMTGLRKSPEERTHGETEVLHDVFTDIHKVNERVLGKIRSLAAAGGMAAAVQMKALAKKLLEYPTAEKWFLSYQTLDAIFKCLDNPVYRRMNSQVNQNAIRKLTAAWSGYFEALKEYRKKPGSFLAKPKIPGYLRQPAYTAWFSNQSAALKERDGKCFLQFVNFPEQICIGKSSLYAGLKYIKTEVKPAYGGYCLLVTFDGKAKEIPLPKNPVRLLGLDPGVGNFLGVGNNFGAIPFVIRSGAIKSFNQWFNKQRAKLLSCRTKGKDSQHSEKDSRQMDTLSRKREAFLRDFFYKCAWFLCRYAKDNRVDAIVIGHNEGQKQEASMGKQNNQNFVSIPYTKFIRILKVVAAKFQIPVVVREESYTSRASLLDGDAIPTYGEKGAQEVQFSGKRVKRGLYQAKDGTLLNADVNGACNILRKEYPHAFDSITDFSYLWETTRSVGYKDLYPNAKALKGRPEGMRFHDAGLAAGRTTSTGSRGVWSTANSGVSVRIPASLPRQSRRHNVKVYVIPVTGDRGIVLVLRGAIRPRKEATDQPLVARGQSQNHFTNVIITILFHDGDPNLCGILLHPGFSC